MSRLRELYYFVRVAEEGQMRSAARRLGVTQPTLSHSIARLESHLGLELLERHSRGVGLTPAGEAYLPKARSVLSAATKAGLGPE